MRMHLKHVLARFTVREKSERGPECFDKAGCRGSGGLNMSS